MLKDSLSLQEMTVLGEVLKEYLTDLRSEILDTDDIEEKIELKHKEEILKDILAKLEKARVATFN
jgi:flagellar hook-basal body complex protein FliE